MSTFEVKNGPEKPSRLQKHKSLPMQVSFKPLESFKSTQEALDPSPVSPQLQNVDDGANVSAQLRNLEKKYEFERKVSSVLAIRNESLRIAQQDCILSMETLLKNLEDKLKQISSETEKGSTMLIGEQRNLILEETLQTSRGIVSQMTATMQKLSGASARVPYKSRAAPLQLIGPESERKDDRSMRALSFEGDSDKRLSAPKAHTGSGSFDLTSSSSKIKLKKHASGTGFIALKERSGTSLLRRSSEMCMDLNDSRPSSIKSIPRRSSDAQLLANGTTNTTAATPEKSFPDSPLLTMMSDKRRGVRLDCMSDDTIDSLATTGRASISVIDDDWSFDKDADVSSKASTKEIFPLLVDSSLENVVMEGKRTDAAIEIEPPIIIEGNVAESTNRGELGQVRLEDDGQECNEIDIADLFEHFLVVGAAPELANEFASQLSSYEKDTFSNMLKRTFHGFLGHSTDRPPLSTRHSVSVAYPAFSIATNPPPPPPSAGSSASEGRVSGIGSANITSSGAGAGAVAGGGIQRQESNDKIFTSSGAGAQPSITKTLFSYFSGVGGLGKSMDSHNSNTLDHRSESVDNPMTAHATTVDCTTKNPTTSKVDSGQVNVGDTLTQSIRTSPSLSTQSAAKEAIVEDPHPVSNGKAPEELGRKTSFSHIDGPPSIAADGDEQKLFEQFVNMVSESESPSLRRKESTEVEVLPVEDTIQKPAAVDAEIDADLGLPVRPVEVGQASPPSAEVQNGVPSVATSNITSSLARISGAMLSRFSSSGSSSFASFSSDQSHLPMSTHSVSASPSTLLAPMTLPPLFRSRSLSSATSSPISNVAFVSPTPSQSKQPSPNDPLQHIQATKKTDDTDTSNKDSNGTTPLDLRQSFSDSEFGSMTDSLELPEDSNNVLTDESKKTEQSQRFTPSKGSDKIIPSSIVESAKTRQQLAAMITSSDKKTGIAVTEPSILYRYPPLVVPPPQEVCDFCLPLGGKLHRLNVDNGSNSATGSRDGVMIEEILYGHGHSKRSSRCFIFLLEDKTASSNTSEDALNDEMGLCSGKLYGICVVHPRLVKTDVPDPTCGTTKKTHPTSLDLSSHSRDDFNPSSVPPKANNCYEFESTVCYAFITRFPLFEFFFQVIFDLISLERLGRMQLTLAAKDQAQQSTALGTAIESDLHFCRRIYQYLPSELLDKCLGKLTKLQAPRYNETISFQMSSSLKAIVRMRKTPPMNIPEHYANAADWALPTLFSWLPAEVIVWAISLLLCEAKVVVVGSESGMVSCAVMGLLVLLRPLDWVSPMIPMLPLKLIDFVESPVPILAGLPLDGSSSGKGLDVPSLLSRCSNMDDGTILAVLDVSQREIFISSTHRDTIDSVCMPDSDLLCQRLRQSLSEGGVSSDDYQSDELTNHNPLLPENLGVTNHGGKDLQRRMSSLGGVSRPAPLYSVSESQKRETEAAQDIIQTHITTVIRAAQDFQVELMDANLMQQQYQQQREMEEHAGRDMKSMSESDDVVSGRGRLISESELSSDDGIQRISFTESEPVGLFNNSSAKASSGFKQFFASSLSTGKRQLSLSNRTLSFGKSALSASKDFFDEDDSSVSPSIREYSPIVGESHRPNKLGKTVSASEQLLQYYTRLVASGSDSESEDLEVVEEGDEVGGEGEDPPPPVNKGKARGRDRNSFVGIEPEADAESSPLPRLLPPVSEEIEPPIENAPSIPEAKIVDDVRTEIPVAVAVAMTPPAKPPKPPKAAPLAVASSHISSSGSSSFSTSTDQHMAGTNKPPAGGLKPILSIQLNKGQGSNKYSKNNVTIELGCRPFSNDETDRIAFLKRFVDTQIFSEYADGVREDDSS